MVIVEGTENTENGRAYYRSNLPFVVLKLEFGLKVISYLLLVFVVDLLSLVLLANLNLFHDLAFCLMT